MPPSAAGAPAGTAGPCGAGSRTRTAGARRFRPRPRAAAAVLLLAGGLLTGCGTPPPDDAVTATPTTPLTPPPTPTGAPMEGEPGDTGAPAPVWDDAAEERARAVATAAMTAYARPTLGAAEWWAGFAPFLTPGAAQDYQWVDPAAIAATTVTGEPIVVDTASVYLAVLDVPTDAGIYQVLLSRQDGPTDWLLERVTPPPGLG